MNVEWNPKMTVAQLTTVARAYGRDVKGLRKAEIIDAIRAAGREREAAEKAAEPMSERARKVAALEAQAERVTQLSDDRATTRRPNAKPAKAAPTKRVAGQAWKLNRKPAEAPQAPQAPAPAPEAGEYVIVGPNLPASAPGYMVVHAKGCADLRRGYCRGADKMTLSAASVREVVEFVYGPEAGSFYEEAGLQDDPNAWTHYVGEFHFAPCCDGLSSPATERTAAIAEAEAERHPGGPLVAVAQYVSGQLRAVVLSDGTVELHRPGLAPTTASFANTEAAQTTLAAGWKLA